ncbi:MAG TPA: LacI family DNA-binding transcriptional regulator [Candidatus Limnocylindria bacterium]
MKALSGDSGGEAPDRRSRRAATIYEVARRAGVSIATVSRVQRRAELVAEPTRHRVERAIEELAYRPSALGRSLARGSHEATGIVFPDLSGPYYSAVILGYEEASAAEGSSVLILGTHRRPGAVDHVLDLADRVDGLVIMGRTVDDAVVRELVRRGLPVVLLARGPVAGSDSVRVDNRTAAEALVTHLVGHGHRAIAFVGDPEASADAAERWDGFRSAHAAAGLDLAFEPVRCAFREVEGRDAGRRILAGTERPTALVGANDEIAMGLLEAARDAGVPTPADLAVTGWDDIPSGRHLSPPLTTVRQPMHDIGRRAAALLHERISGARTEPRHVVLPTELVVRSSCGCAAPTSEGGGRR